MGIYCLTYIGPYVACGFDNKFDKQQYRCCPNKNCREYHKRVWQNYFFCPFCGFEIELTEFSISVEGVDKEKIRMVPDFDEALYTPLGDELYLWQKQNNVHIWMPNKHLKCEEYPEIVMDNKQSSIQDIPVELPAKQIEAFKTQFKNALLILERNYGKEKMTYKWGVVHQVH